MEYRINLTDDTVEQLGRVLGEPVQELEQEILEKEETIAEKDEIIAEKQAIIDAFPTIESKSITANGTYSEEGKAYSPVVVNVPQTTVEALSVTQNGTYSEAGKAYSPVTVNVPNTEHGLSIPLTIKNTGTDRIFVNNTTISSNGLGSIPAGETFSTGTQYWIYPVSELESVTKSISLYFKKSDGANPSISLNYDLPTGITRRGTPAGRFDMTVDTSVYTSGTIYIELS